MQQDIAQPKDEVQANPGNTEEDHISENTDDTIASNNRITVFDLQTLVGMEFDAFEKEAESKGAEYLYSIDEIDAATSYRFLFVYDLQDNGRLIVAAPHENGIRHITGAYLFSQNGELLQAAGKELIPDPVDMIPFDTLIGRDELLAQLGSAYIYSETEHDYISRIVYLSDNGVIHEWAFFSKDDVANIGSSFDMIHDEPVYFYNYLYQCASTDGNIRVTQLERHGQFEVRLYQDDFSKPAISATIDTQHKSDDMTIHVNADEKVETVAELIQQYGNPFVKAEFVKSYFYDPQGLAYLYFSDNGQVVLFDVDETETNVLGITLLGRTCDE
jgi:hypothetical protein